MYRFQIRAQTQTGESIALVGSTPELGLWDLTKCVHLHTNADRYPLWWTDSIALQPSLTATDYQKIEYKYVRLAPNGRVQWEALGANRRVSIAPKYQSYTIVMDDGAFGYWQPYPFGYIEEAAIEMPQNTRVEGLKPEGLKIVLIGSSVAVGHKAWLLQGWAAQLEQSLQEKYGHSLVNVAEVGATVSRTIDRFASVVPPEQPDVVIIALSLGNEGFAYCPTHERRTVQRRFESGLQQLVKLTRQLGARPVLGSVYPHGDYSPEHYRLLQDTYSRMLNWGVPVLDWLAAVDDGQGRWRDGLSFDPAHPNLRGHHLMYQALDLSLFQLDKAALAAEKQRGWHQTDSPIYLDPAGFQVSARLEEKQLRLTNPSTHSYTITPYWQELQTALRHAGLV